MNSTNLPEFKHLMNAIEVINKADSDIPVDALFLMLLIHEHDEITTKKLSELSQISLARCSSLVSKLSDSYGLFRKGLGYVVRTPKVIGGKRVMDCKLSPAGAEFIKTFTA